MSFLDKLKGFSFDENKKPNETNNSSSEVTENAKKEVSEDMLSASDSPEFQMTSIDGPGQVPAQLPTDMDTFALAGPGKKTKKTKKKKKGKETVTPLGKVLNFADFMKSR